MTLRTGLGLTALVGWLATLAACGGPTDDELAQLEAVSGIPLTPPATPPPVPWADDTLPAPADGRYRARQVLIAWRGALDAPPSVTRSEVEARTLAETLWLQSADGADLAALARTHGDGPTAARGGLLGTFTPGTLHPLLEAAVAAVGPGHTGPLVRTPQGMHIVERLALDEAVVGQVTFGYAGAHRSAASRGRDEARALAEAAAAALRSGTAPTSLQADASRDPAPLGRRQWSADLEAIAFDLAPGEVSPVIDTPLGFVVVVAGSAQ